MKFKVGDKVKVIKNRHSSGLNIGDKTIIKCIYQGDYQMKDGWWHSEDELKLIKPKLTEERIREIIREEVYSCPEIEPFNNLSKDQQERYKPKEDTVTINGYEMKQEGNSIKFGCMSFTSSRVEALYKNCLVLGVTRFIVETIEGEVTLDQEKLKQIVNNIK